MADHPRRVHDSYRAFTKGQRHGGDAVLNASLRSDDQRYRSLWQGLKPKRGRVKRIVP